tara:strand:+ start:3648 stop:5189 length:1542 start_codon:yes stop_codon:yes gene_type:complete
MKKSFTSNYINIYLWKTISIVTGFISLLIVLPRLSNNLELFGLYSFCISLTIYLTYSDLGFLGAVQKYAAEYFALGDSETEIELLGFMTILLVIMIIPFSIFMIFLSFNPSLVISDISNDATFIASQFFLIMAIFFPIQIILQRLSQSILIIRVKDYIGLKIDVFANMIKILSVFYFFSNNTYLIVEYFFFITLITIVSQLYILFQIKKSENYDFLKLINSIKFSKKYYNISKKLAFSSFALTFGWLIYYELDLILIGNLFGVKEIGIYAVAFTFLNFLRSLWNSVFLPFAQRFNHFVAENSFIKIKELLNNLIDYTFPLSILITVTLFLSIEKLIIFWVGVDYIESILILQILVIGVFFTFINLPASHYFSALTKYNYIYALAVMFPTVFLVSIFITYSDFGLNSIAISKSFTNLIAFVISFIGIIKFIDFKIFFRWLFPVTLVLIFYHFGFTTLLNFFFIENYKSSFLLFKLICFLISTFIISYLLLIFYFKKNRVLFAKLFNSLIKYFSK